MDEREVIHRDAYGKNVKGKRLFVSNLAFETQWKYLKDHMRQAGDVVRADIFENKDGTSRGIGYVQNLWSDGRMCMIWWAWWIDYRRFRYWKARLAGELAGWSWIGFWLGVAFLWLLYCVVLLDWFSLPFLCLFPHTCTNQLLFSEWSNSEASKIWIVRWKSSTRPC